MKSGVTLPKWILPAVVLVSLSVASAIASPTGFAHKAVANEASASVLAGGFDPEQRRVYHDGLSYIRSAHLPIGAYTIGEVIRNGRVSHSIHEPPLTQPDDSSGSALGLGMFLLVGVGALLFFARMFRKVEKTSTVDAYAAAEQWMKEATSGILKPFASVPIAQHRGERFYLDSSDAHLIAEHRHAEYVGASGGLSFRVAPGLYARTGRSRGRRVDHVTVGVDDRGPLYASNQRIVFVGQRHTIEIPLAKVIAIDAYKDGLKINRANGKAVVLRTGVPTTAVVLRRILAGDVFDPQAAEKDFLEKRAALVEEANIAFTDAKKKHDAGQMSDQEYRQLADAFDKFQERAKSKPPSTAT